MMTPTELRVGGLSLSLARSAGPGQDLLLLHGVGRCWRDFVPLLQAFAPRWRVTAVDHRGHGGSGRADSYLVADYARDVAGLLGVLGANDRRAVIYGHSLGALVALEVAQAAPESVRALVLEDPPSEPFLQRLPATVYGPVFRAMRSLAGSPGPVSDVAKQLGDVWVPSGAPGGGQFLRQLRDPASLRFSARCLLDLDPNVFAPLLETRWTDGSAGEAGWPRVACPVLLLAADEGLGGMLPRADAERMAGRLPDCTKIDVPGVGHLVHWAATETTLRLVLNFLESLDPPNW